MDIININKEEFNCLDVFNPGKDISHEECILKVMGRYMFKYYCIRHGDYLSWKLVNINTFYDNKEVFKSLGVVVPEYLLAVGDEVSGFAMEYIDGINVQNLLKSENVSIHDKVRILNRIYNLIKGIHSINLDYSVCLGDVHEGNFMFDTKSGDIKIVDADSFYISNNKPFPSKYLFINNVIGKYPNKYKCNSFGIVTPSFETDIFCYVTMVINTFLKSDISRFSYEEFNNYLDYLDDIGLPKEYVNSLLRIYSDEENINPLMFIKDKENLLSEANILSYKKRTGKSL